MKTFLAFAVSLVFTVFIFSRLLHLPLPAFIPIFASDATKVDIIAIYHPGDLENEYFEAKIGGRKSRIVTGWQLFNDCPADNLVFDNQFEARIYPGQTVKIYTKKGKIEGTTGYLNLTEPIWEPSLVEPQLTLKDENHQIVTQYNCD